MASYIVNKHAVAQARRLIDAHQYVLESVWGDIQPSADDGSTFLEGHSWDDYAAWHLGLTDSANDDTKARYAFVYGDFRRVHRMGLIACLYRAAEWRWPNLKDMVGFGVCLAPVQRQIADRLGLVSKPSTSRTAPVAARKSRRVVSLCWPSITFPIEPEAKDCWSRTIAPRK